jgi:hypothetical protein
VDPIFLTSSQDGGEWSASRPGRFTPRGKSARYQFNRRLGGTQSQSGRRGEEKLLTLPGLELRTLGRPARGESLYRLRYPGSNNILKYEIILHFFHRLYFVSFGVSYDIPPPFFPTQH